MGTLFVASLLCVTSATGQTLPPERGTVTIVAAVVAKDLSVRPVPRLQLFVFHEPRAETDSPAAEIVTSFDGTVTAPLDAGRYRVVSGAPATFDGEALSWDLALEVAAGAAVRLELSNDNARRSVAKRPDASRSEGEVFEASRGSVFLVETDSGHGSGFLVERDGLIVTNDHVLGQTRHVAVVVERSRKYRAAIVARDTDHDIAVVRVHPDAVADRTPLRLAASDTTVTVGDRVLTIGSPLTARTATLTTGTVGKVDPETITSDVNLNPGNSGGPLLDLRGEVIGVSTFGQRSAVGGPGIAGIVRIHLAEKALVQGRASISLPPPPADLLPVVPLTPYPVSALREAVAGKFDAKKYRIDAGKVDVHIVTPPLAFYLQHELAIKAAEAQKKRARGKGQTDPGADTYQWQADAGGWDAVVAIRALPEVEMTGGSRVGRIFGGIAGVVTPANYRFKTDFRAMKLLRDGIEVLPIHPGRVCEAVQEQAGLNRLRDVGCMGVYQYPVDAFAPGGALELYVYNEDEPDLPTICRLPPVLIDKVWNDFKPYFALVRRGSD